MISPWSKSVFYKTFPSTLAYAILCAREFPFFFLYFPIFFYFSILISLNLELVPPCRIAIRNVTSLAIGVPCWCTSGAFLRVGSIGIRLRPIRCWYFAIGQYDGVALLRFLSSRRATLRRPRRRPYQGYKISRRSTSIGFTTQRARST